MTAGRQCQVHWCDRVERHTGPHRRELGQIRAVDVDPWRPATIMIRLQGESARVKALILDLDGRQVALTWSQVAEFAGDLSAAYRAWAPPP